MSKISALTLFRGGLSGNNGIQGKHILSVDQFQPDTIAYLFDLTRRVREVCLQQGGIDVFGFRSDRKKVMSVLFYEPSTRTSSSFISAMTRLGGSVIPITQGVQFSSLSAGETLEDTIRTLEQYSDLIVLRHPETGAAARAAAVAQVPIINAGDGIGEHPTQALLDLFTINDELGGLNGLTVTLAGDLRYGRTIHSLAKLLLPYQVKVRLVSPEILRLPLLLKNQLKDAGIDLRETQSLREVVEETDVLYVTRVQEEHFVDQTAYESIKGMYLVDPTLMKMAKEKMIVMHPLPRGEEIAGVVDEDPRAVYFRQIKNGLYLRMALLAAVLR